MLTIYKYKVPFVGHPFTIDLPADAQICDFHQQGNYFYLWAMIDSNKPTIKAGFIVLGTGCPIPASVFCKANHVFTAHHDGIVWHLLRLIFADDIPPEEVEAKLGAIFGENNE